MGVIGIPDEFYSALIELLGAANDWLASDSIQDQNDALVRLGHLAHVLNGLKPKGDY